MAGIGTQWVRKDVGMSTMDNFLCYVICVKNWDFYEIESDLRQQIKIRGGSVNLADQLTERMMDRLRKRLDPKKIKSSISGAIDAVKKFELTPMAIAKIAYGTMGALAEMAQDANDCAFDRNRYHFGWDGERDQYIDYMIYTYVCNGRVQPRYTGII
jgi:hypothetical protein